MTTIETERLLLRGWRDDDLDPLAAVNADPEVMRYILDGSVRDRGRTEADLRRIRDGWDQRGFGLFAVEVRATGRLIGWAGLAVPEFLPEVLPAVEIGWRLARDAWGQGYATEAATAALRFGFDDRGLDRVISIRHVDNARSERVMTKLGLTPEFETVVPGHDQPVAVHAISRDRYRTRRGSAGNRPAGRPR
ncbi:GNAT family N-acetyltransferase [Asanoa sp. WMMD1127]|uniref:GNAT family N-acetyltransferase n=1 Tax=Asanoa sp. WMMD1127 TaxID=3016107 RepID=UPI002416ED21|nr:GNAT family N-acetyltransferase [Asanoa sp. WMMD1127]MDG4826408.1 GNAT family N-acetyltransferase [Asanoa sp. WMMD1127]